MTEHPRDCISCRSWRLAVRISLALLAGMLLTGIIGRAARAETIVACEKVELPGKEHTLNPHDPPEKQRQEKVSVCSQVEIERAPNRLAPIVDRKRDTRTWA